MPKLRLQVLNTQPQLLPHVITTLRNANEDKKAWNNKTKAKL